MKTSVQHSTSRRRAIALVASAIALLLLPGGLVWLRTQGTPAPDQLLAQAKASLKQHDFVRSENLALRVPRSHELWGRAQLVAGEAATKSGRPDAALLYYLAIPRDGSETAVVAAFSTAELQRDAGRLTEAEREYRDVLEHRPQNAAAHERLAFLLGVTGRRWESSAHLEFLLREGSATLEELVILGDLERPVDQKSYLETCAKRFPHDDLVRLGLAALASFEGRSNAARDQLRDLVAGNPTLLAAQGLLGELLVDATDVEFLRWHAALPAAADNDVGIWFARGLWARRHEHLRVAARCFWEAIRRAPTHRRASYQLGQVLVSLGEASAAEFSLRAGQLFDLGQNLDNVVRSQGKDERTLQRVVALLEQMGRAWEAWAWADAALRQFPRSRWPRDIQARLAKVLREDSPLMLDPANLALKYNFSKLPGPARLAHLSCKGPRGVVPHGRFSPIRLVESPDAGIDFAYFNGNDPTTLGARMFEQSGGGVAVLDFDLDGRPDLYFTQGLPWRQGDETPTVANDLTDCLYRNEGGKRFINATRAAALVDREFGQGPAVGDYDNDGFPDLYVANIGRNRLHRNNGDGTFTDATDAAGLEGGGWTASCVVVDLNADGLPDLFDVTYLTGAHVYDAICNGRACSPKVFEGAPDRLHLNQGDGTFQLIAEAVPLANSKGLGVVAFDMGPRGRPSLFISNDQVPNYLLRNTPTNDRLNIRLEDQGFASGLAFNEDGLAMASMGIAADDINGDGRLDFYVTTFKDESKILFLQDAAGLFVDATNAAGLRASSVPFVGWGAQFLDADRDGAADLVLVNGHVDDYRDVGGEYQMRPQFFRNTGDGRFVELLGAAAGEFFNHKRLGRGLARLDWNGDGRMDFVVSNIGETASLVTNQTAGPGRFLNVRLHATTTARDAIGSVVAVAAGNRNWSKQLVAGDGYMASNERILQFGLGDVAAVKNLRVEWPSGGTTIVSEIPVDATLVLVESSPRALVWRGAETGSLAAAVQPLK